VIDKSGFSGTTSLVESVVQSRNLAIALGAFAGMVTLASSPAKAGLLDMLFGSAPAPRIEMPLEMTVRPEGKPRTSKPKSYNEAPPKLATPINPEEFPDWYLTDPTLRRGDIVVLPKKVLVFSGGRGTRQLSDFDNLGESRMVSSRERERIKLMTEYAGGPLAKYKIVPDRESEPPALKLGADRTVNVVLP
jgi:hypothetical protein